MEWFRQLPPVRVGSAAMFVLLGLGALAGIGLVTLLGVALVAAGQ